MEKSVIDNYYKLFLQCLNSDDWNVVDYQSGRIQNLSCEIVHFFNKNLADGSRNFTFFIVNNVIIGVGGEYMEDVSLLSQDY